MTNKGCQLILSLTLAGMFFFSATGSVSASGLICEKQMAMAAKKHGIPLGILYAIGLTETGRRNTLHPYALNVSGKSYFPKSKAAALLKFQESKNQGEKLIDLGCMQINHYYHSSNFSSTQQMLDPRKNVEYAALFLKRLYKREGTWTLAAARYHAGPKNLTAQKKYVCIVITNLVASGFGAWTDNAKKFCN